MIAVLEPAYAKLNLTLDVLGLREDGYHDLKSIMQTVDYCDDIRLDIGTGLLWNLTCTDPDIPNDSRNLAWKAARAFYDATGIADEGLTIHITKRIPSQAGMGGGSSDAAAVLRGLNRHYGNPVDLMALADIGAKVGSDVPFCVLGGTVMCEGRGERLRPITSMPDCVILVCKPEFSMSTPALYRVLDEAGIDVHPDNDAMEIAIDRGDLTAIGSLLSNVFDPVVSASYPLMDQLRQMYMDSGALGCQMSGSGSAFFGIMPDRESAERLAPGLANLCKEVFITKPV